MAVSQTDPPTLSERVASLEGAVPYAADMSG